MKPTIEVKYSIDPPRLVLLAATLALILKLALTCNTYGATDALLWETNLQILRTEGAHSLYQHGTRLANGHSEIFNHPPFMLRAISAWGFLADHTGLPLRFWLRLTCALADFGSIGLLLAGLARSKLRYDARSLMLVAIAPASVMISGFHGNTDPIMVSLLLLSIFLLETRPAWLAGAAFGLATGVKIVPVIFAPALLLTLGGRKAARFMASAALVFVAISWPMIVQDPMLIVQRVFGYTPQSGIWGVSIPMAAIGGEAELLYRKVAKFAAIGLMVAAAVWMRRREMPIWRQCAIMAFLFLAITPGFGVQYLAWLVPWMAMLRFRAALAFHLSSGVFLFAYYTKVSGLPWYISDSTWTPAWDMRLVMIGVGCWMVIAYAAWALRGDLDALAGDR